MGGCRSRPIRVAAAGRHLLPCTSDHPWRASLAVSARFIDHSNQGTRVIEHRLFSKNVASSVASLARLSSSPERGTTFISYPLTTNARWSTIDSRTYSSSTTRVTPLWFTRVSPDRSLLPRIDGGVPMASSAWHSAHPRPPNIRSQKKFGFACTLGSSHPVKCDENARRRAPRHVALPEMKRRTGSVLRLILTAGDRNIPSRMGRLMSDSADGCPSWCRCQRAQRARTQRRKNATTRSAAAGIHAWSTLGSTTTSCSTPRRSSSSA